MTPGGAGIGIDVVDVDRFERALNLAGFREKIFTPMEIETCEAKRDSVHAYAARFAAKEAFFKALADPHLKAVPWTQIETVMQGDIPTLKLHGAYRKHLGDRRAFLSLSHSYRVAAAVVMLLPPEQSDSAD